MEENARKPSSKARVLATTGAIIIHTSDGNVVMTPGLARAISAHLVKLADLAEMTSRNRFFNSGKDNVQ